METPENNEQLTTLTEPIIPTDPFSIFKLETGSTDFKLSWMSYFTFVVLILFVAQGLAGDQTALLKNLDEPMRLFVYSLTIIFQWLIAGIIFGAIYLEKTKIRSVGLVKIRLVDFAWGIALLFSLFIVSIIASLTLTALGIPPKGEIAFLLPQELPGKILWVLVSFTAGYCEELIFRGYIMTRVRLLLKSKSWVVPTIVSAFAFGFPHYYQGLPGFIVITLLGVMFSLIYIRTKSLWPCIIAHFLLDFVALFVPVDM